MAGRMDLRDWQMVTIDGEDAKDLDDAVSLQRREIFTGLASTSPMYQLRSGKKCTRPGGVEDGEQAFIWPTSHSHATP